MKITVIRRITLSLVFLVLLIGLFFHTGTGTLSSMGIGYIASICPLGAVESFLASKLFIPRTWIVLILVVIAVILLGKVFCAWLCPVPPIKRFFTKKKAVPKVEAAEIEAAEAKTAAMAALSDEEKASLSATACSSCDDDAAGNGKKKAKGCASCAEKRAKLDSRHVVLGGALLSTAFFGFPVFCLVCPVGLTFATLIAVWRLVGFNEPSWMLVIFPAILIIEILVLRKWCLKWCPLGAVMSLLSIPNRFFKPKVDESKCLRNKGVECVTCVTVCEEGLDPHYSDGMHECSKCGLCKDHCPAKAITIPFNPGKAPKAPDTALPDKKVA
jgi:ferredoxin-type protein NapH